MIKPRNLQKLSLELEALQANSKSIDIWDDAAISAYNRQWEALGGEKAQSFDPTFLRNIERNKK